MPKIDDHDIRRGDTGQIIAQWWRPVAYKVALDMLHQAICSALHWRIIMAIEITYNGDSFVHRCRLFRLYNHSLIT
jgi:hypothetical protein